MMTSNNKDRHLSFFVFNMVLLKTRFDCNFLTKMYVFPPFCYSGVRIEYSFLLQFLTKMKGFPP